jgi:phage regulator Rha-like protein
MSLGKRRSAVYLPWAFTEHGALMAANILNSTRAVEMSVFVIRAFVRMREALATNARPRRSAKN